MKHCFSGNESDIQFPVKLFLDRGPYHTETSPLICRASQWTGFNIIGTSVMKELKLGSCACFKQTEFGYIISLVRTLQMMFVIK